MTTEQRDTTETLEQLEDAIVAYFRGGYPVGDIANRKDAEAQLIAACERSLTRNAAPPAFYPEPPICSVCRKDINRVAICRKMGCPRHG